MLTLLSHSGSPVLGLIKARVGQRTRDDNRGTDLASKSVVNMCRCSKAGWGFEKALFTFFERMTDVENQRKTKDETLC